MNMTLVSAQLYIYVISSQACTHHSTLSYTKILKRRRKEEKPEDMTSNKNTAATGVMVAVVLLLLATMPLMTTVADARSYLDVLPPSTSHGVVENLLPHKSIPRSGPSDFWGGEPLPPVEVKINHGN
jgi:hypothetical protein